MVAFESFFVIFLSIFTLGSTNSNGSGVLHRVNDSFNVNQENPYSSGSASKPESDIPPKLTYNTGGSRLDSPSDIKIRLSLCCSVEVARKHGNCLTNKTPTDIVPRIVTRINGHVDQKDVLKRNFDLVISDPCDFDWLVPSLLNNFSVLEDGSISDEDSSAEMLYDFEHYCLFRNPEVVDYSARVCYELIRISIWKCFCAVIVILIMLAIFIVYSIIPEYKNLHGMMFRAYIGTYGILAVGVLAWELTSELRTKPYLYSVSDASVRFCAGSCACWLNAMSFDIWRSFRGLRPIDSQTRECEKRKFIRYAVYAWGSPAIVLAALLIPIYYLPYLRREILGYNTKFLASLGVICIVYISNTSLFISTGLAIRKHRINTALLTNNVTYRRHHSINEQWFQLHIKLFVLMGGHTVMWIIWLIWPSLATSSIFGATELVQAIFMFVTFIWKEDIKQSFRKKLTTLTMKE